MIDQVAADLNADLVALVDRYVAVDTTALSGTAAAELSHLLAEQTSRLAAVRLGAVATVADSGVWGLDGSRSAAAWLARTERCGSSTAGRDVRTARSLREHLPHTVAAVLDGAVPVEHAHAIARACLRTTTLTRAMASREVGEPLLLEQAHLGIDDFQKVLNVWAGRADPEAADASYREDRGKHHLVLADSTDGTHVTGKLSPQGGETLRAALLAQIGIPAKEDHRTQGQRMHDALVALAAAALDGGSLGRGASVRPQVVVHVDYPTYEALLSPEGDSSEGQPERDASAVVGSDGLPGLLPATLQESGQPLAPELFRRIHCDSEVTRIVFGPAGEVLDVGRSQRTFKGPLRRALDARDGGCRAPNCSNPPRLCEGHHRVPWHLGGTTSVRDGLLLCWSCHGWVHALDITIDLTPGGGLRFTDRHRRHLGTTYPRHHPTRRPRRRAAKTSARPVVLPFPVRVDPVHDPWDDD